jgi:predicted nuclease with TOPRIM domain
MLESSPVFAWTKSARASLLFNTRGGAMAGHTLDERVTALENTVDRLQKLPGELAAFRQEFESFRKEVNTRFDEQYAHMRMLHEDLVERISLLGERKRRPPKPRR